MRISDWSSDVCSSDLRSSSGAADPHHYWSNRKSQWFTNQKRKMNQSLDLVQVGCQDHGAWCGPRHIRSAPHGVHPEPWRESKCQLTNESPSPPPSAGNREPNASTPTSSEEHTSQHTSLMR